MINIFKAIRVKFKIAKIRKEYMDAIVQYNSSGSKEDLMYLKFTEQYLIDLERLLCQYLNLSDEEYNKKVCNVIGMQLYARR